MKKIQDILQNDIDEVFKKHDLIICSFLITPCVGDIKVYCYSSYNIHNAASYQINEKRFGGWENVPCKYSQHYVHSLGPNEEYHYDPEENSSSVFDCGDCTFKLNEATSFFIEASYIGEFSGDIKAIEKDIEYVVEKCTKKKLYKLNLKESRC